MTQSEAQFVAMICERVRDQLIDGQDLRSEYKQIRLPIQHRSTFRFVTEVEVYGERYQLQVRGV